MNVVGKQNSSNGAKRQKLKISSSNLACAEKTKFNSRSRSEAVENKALQPRMPIIKQNTKISPPNLLADIERKSINLRDIRKNGPKLHSKQPIVRKESNSSAVYSKAKKVSDFERIMNFSLDNEIKKLKPKASFEHKKNTVRWKTISAYDNEIDAKDKKILKVTFELPQIN